MASSTSASTSTQTLLARSELIRQGAEAKVYKGCLISRESNDNNEGDGTILLKYRFTKQYRHPSLDTTLTKARVAGEARALMKCLRAGVCVPGIRLVDAPAGVLGIEWIDGQSVRLLLGDDSDEAESPELGDTDGEVPSSAHAEDEIIDVEEASKEIDLLKPYGLSQEHLMSLIGTQIAKMHAADVIHGDLTTSNMMLRRASPSASSSLQSELVLIDFGLSFVSTLAEDKAVDLYVLERAFASTHPNSEPLFDLVLKAYAEESGKDWVATERKLHDVRLRGRKRSMVG